LTYVEIDQKRGCIKSLLDTS